MKKKRKKTWKYYNSIYGILIQTTIWLSFRNIRIESNTGEQYVMAYDDEHEYKCNENHKETWGYFEKLRDFTSIEMK